MATTRCIFCGATPTTNEDVVPDWLGKYLNDHKPAPSSPDKRVVAMLTRGRIDLDGTAYREGEWTTEKQPRFLAKCVCENCNNRWMSDIEANAKPLLIQMIEGKQVELDSSDQESLAKWLGLKALITHYVRPDQPRMMQEWIEGFFAKKSPPLGWHIRIGRYSGDRQLVFYITEMESVLHHPLVPFLFKQPAFLYTIAVGRFVGQVYGATQQQAFVETRGQFRQIWPSPFQRTFGGLGDGIESWPPLRELTDSDLLQLRNSLVVASA